MEPGQPDHGFTRVEGQHPDVFPSSPNALIGVFVAVLQSRFHPPIRPENLPWDLPWEWDIDPTPQSDDAGVLPDDTAAEARPLRRIYIESAFTEYPTARNIRPALLVSRGPVQLVRLGVGHRAAHDFPRGGEVLMCHGMTSVTVDCLSREDAESATLADVVASFFLASAPEIRSAFSIHGMEPPAIGETTPVRRTAGELESWSTKVTLSVEIQYKWWRWPLAPVIREIAARLSTNGEVVGLREVLQR